MSYSDDTSEKMLLNQMEVDRKLRDDLRWDSLKLSWEFYKLLYCESQAHKAFIPRRFEDLKLNGGVGLKRIPIKLNYHRSRFKKSKSPRRTLDLADSLDRTGTGLAISQRCVRVKTVRMKKQDHHGKRTTQVKLAQACKSLGMFLDSPSFRNPKDYMMIRLDKKQISDTGVKRETHLFVYGLTFLALRKIDCHVDTWIGDQSIFAEEVKELERDDPDAVMESLQDETSMVSEFKETAKYKSRVKISHVQQQRGQRGFHKVRFKVRLRRSYKATTQKVREDGNAFAQDADGLRVKRSWYLTRVVIWQCFHRARVKGSANYSNKISLKRFGKGVMEVGTLQNHLTPYTLRNRVKKPCKMVVPEALYNRRYLLQKKFRVKWGYHKTRKKKLSVQNSLVKAFRELNQKELDRKNASARHMELHYGEEKERSGVVSHSNHVWKPGRLSKKLTEPLWSPFDDSLKELKAIRCSVAHLLNGDKYCEELVHVRELGSVQGSVKDAKVLAFDPGGASSENVQELAFDMMGYVFEMESKTDQALLFHNPAETKQFWQWRDGHPELTLELFASNGINTVSILMGVKKRTSRSTVSTGSQNPNVDGNRVWNPGALVVEEDKSYSSVTDEKLWIAEYMRISIMDVQTNSEHEVKWVVVLESQKSFSNCGDVFTVPAFGFWSLEDKAVILLGSILKLYCEKTVKLFLSAEKKIIEAAADCQEMNSQDLENVLMTFILASHSQYNWSWCWILVVHNVRLCLCVSALCYHLNFTGQELEEDNKTQGPVTLRHVSGAHDIDSNIQWHLTCGDVSQVLVVVYTSVKQTSSWLHGSVTDGDGDPSGRSCEKISGVLVKLAMQMGHNHNKFLLQLNYQDSLSKEGRVSYVYSNSGMSDALLNHKMDTPTSEKLQGTEEMMRFYFYDWFQSPRPPELSKTGNLVSLLYISALVTGLNENHGNGALVITASKVGQLEDKLAPDLHQLEDKLVLHRGSIDKYIDGPPLYLMGH